MDKIYQWNQNAGGNLGIAHADVNLVVEEIKGVAEANGEVTPKLIVERSKKKDSALHDYFDWNNKSAGEKWRLLQASRLIGAIEVRVVKDEGSKIVRAYEVISRHERKYMPFDELSEKQESNVLKFLIGDLVSVKNRLARFNGKAGEAVTHIEIAITELQAIKKEELIEAGIVVPSLGADRTGVPSTV